MSLVKGNSITSGFFWNFISLIVRRGISFIVQLILAKLLFPDDFGLIGMAMVFTTIFRAFSDAGTGAAIIQMKEDVLTPLHMHTAFWSGIGWSIVVYTTVCFLVTPAAAVFYEEDLLLEIIPVIALGILFSGLSVVQRAILTRKMDFKRLALIQNSGSVIGGVVAIIMALTGYGVWALVAYYVLPVIVEGPILFKTTKYFPERKFGKKEFDEIFSFGLSTTGTSVVNNLINQLDYLLVGKIVSSYALGIYTFAFVVTVTLKDNLISVVNSVMFPAYSRVQDDKKQVGVYYLTSIKYNAALVYLMAAGLLVVGDEIILSFFGNKWSESIPIMQILTVSVVFHMFINGHTVVLRSLGEPGLEFRLQSFKGFFFFAPVLFVLVNYYGGVGAAVAVTLNKIAAIPLAFYYLKKYVDISVVDQVRSVLWPFIAMILAVCAGVGIEYFFPNIYFGITGLLIFVLYSSCLFLLMRAEVLVLVNVVKNKI